MSQNLVCPENLQIFCREIDGWTHIKGKVFYNPKQKQTDLDSTLKRFNFTKSSIICELFKLNGGSLGYYLADLENKKFYYCGSEFLDIKVKLLSLGIGRMSINE